MIVHDPVEASTSTLQMPMNIIIYEVYPFMHVSTSLQQAHSTNICTNLMTLLVYKTQQMIWHLVCTLPLSSSSLLFLQSDSRNN
jgi:hypothetical protein